MQSTPDILIADDDVALCELLVDYLSTQGLQAQAVHSAEAAIEHIRTSATPPQVLVLDVMLPGMTGLEAMSQIRAESSIPVLMLSARGEPIDRILGLELGADDYLAKPAMPRELLARIRALLRRQQTSAPQASSLELGDLRLDPSQRRAEIAGQRLKLTGAEFGLLRLLVSKAGEILSKQVLTEEALGRNLERYDRAVDVHISRLRKKLTDAGAAVHIESVRGSGYVLVFDDA